MKLNSHRLARLALLLVMGLGLATAAARLQAQTGCPNNPTPFIDLGQMPTVFCQAVAQAFFSGLTSGTSATTYSPAAAVTRDQMAAFITRTQDSGLERGSLRAALNQWETPAAIPPTAITTVGMNPQFVASDGDDLWVSNFMDGTVSRVRASDGRLLETWTGATNASGVAVSRGRVYVTGQTVPGRLYVLDPGQPAGAVTTLANALGNQTVGAATDGTFIWTTNSGSNSVSRVNPDTGAGVNISGGFSSPFGILYDGSSIWVTNFGNNTLVRLNADGSVAQTLNVGTNPGVPTFDGTNIWVPNRSTDPNSITVVRVKDALGNPLTNAFVLATLTGNGLAGPQNAAFDGQRVLVSNADGLTLSLWKAADLSPLGSFPTPTFGAGFGVASDGINFWVVLPGLDGLARF